jgi:hypothetical protein
MFTQDLEDMAEDTGKGAPEDPGQARDTRDTAAPAAPGTPRKNPLLTTFGAMAQRYHDMTGTPLADITRLVSELIGMPLRDIATGADAATAEAVLQELIDAAGRSAAAEDAPVVYESEDIDF